MGSMKNQTGRKEILAENEEKQAGNKEMPEEGRKKQTDKKVRRNDVVLIVGGLALALIAYFGISFYQGISTKDAEAVVLIADEEIGRYPLDTDITEKIELPDGSYNVLEIKDGEARITEASCPDKICVNHRAVSKQNQSIVCLPNKVVVEIQNGEASELDAVAN